MSADPEYGRRHFIKDSVLSIAKTAHEYVKHRDAPAEPAKPERRSDWLRPPGAVEEALFLDRCTRCADCVEACPHGSIQFDVQDGSPVIFPDRTPCHLCEDFPCIAACAADALVHLRSIDRVSMGRAVVSHRDCTAGQGCHACVSKCPMDALVMSFESFRLGVEEARCVGCGICVQVCATVNDKIAIRVTPERLLG